MKKMYKKTPTVYQMEATECGAACLSMILGYYGKFLPLEQLRIETGVSRDGCNAWNILQAAEKFGLKAEGWRKSTEQLLKLTPPCIIHWNFNHYVVWEGQKGKYAYINDPAEGRRKLTIEEVDECFTGVVLTFEKTQKFEKTKTKKTLSGFIRQRLKGQYGPLLALFAISLCMVIPGLAAPVFTQVFIDHILLGGNTGWISALLAVMGGTVLLNGGLTWYRGIVFQKLQNKMALVSAHKFLSHMLRLPMNFFAQRYSGDLAQRVENNDNVANFLAGELGEVLLNSLMVVFYLILMLLYSPLLTLIGLTSVAVNLITVRLNADAMAHLTMKFQQDEGNLMGVVSAGLRISSTLKASGIESDYISKIQGMYARSIEPEQKMGKKQEILNAIPELTDELTGVLLLLAGGLLVIRGQITAGMLTAFITLFREFTAPVNKLAGFAKQIQQLKADMWRVDDIMSYEEDEKFYPQEKAEMEGKLDGEVTVSHVSFGYSTLEKPFVQDFSFHLDSGSSVAFVGASGCGKSTVSRIISGLYLPWEGEVCLDGMPVSSIPEGVISGSVSTVSQEITLFSGTIRDNMTLWNPNITDENMIKAAKDACIHEVITGKPGAYEFRLTEGGTNLSGGQRQRLEIARALVTNPSILIMDEATSALDPTLEKKILDNIKRRGCTCIIVAHRLSAIRDCDEILVMEDGKIVQRGTHDQLAAVEGIYRNLIHNT